MLHGACIISAKRTGTHVNSARTVGMDAAKRISDLIGADHPCSRALVSFASKGRRPTTELLRDVRVELLCQFRALRAYVVFGMLDDAKRTDVLRRRREFCDALARFRREIRDTEACGPRCNTRENIKLCDCATDVAEVWLSEGADEAVRRAETWLAPPRSIADDGVVTTTTATTAAGMLGASKAHLVRACDAGGTTVGDAQRFVEALKPYTRLECADNQRTIVMELKHAAETHIRKRHTR